MDFLRLKSIARWHARGLPPDVTWDDLLQEAVTRVLVGSRRQPEGLTMVAFLAGVMRSLRTNTGVARGKDLGLAIHRASISSMIHRGNSRCATQPLMWNDH